MFPDLTCTSVLAFAQTLYKQVFQTLYDYNLTWVFQFILHLMMLTLFQGQRCV